METIKIGTKAPAFVLPNQDEERIRLEDFYGQWLVLYFYPKDNTQGCTLEAVDFTGAAEDFARMNCQIVGVSPDSTKSHCRFREKHKLTISLLSDPGKTVLQQYGVWQLKKMYGREYYGVVRSTFLVDPQGIIASVWPNVRVKGHVDAVKAKLKELQIEKTGG